MWKALRRSFAFWFGLSMILSGLSFVPRLLEKKGEHEHFLRDGRVTDAPVLERTAKDGDSKYLFEIQYYDSQRNQYPKFLEVDRELFEKYRRGSSLPVRYLVNSPETMIPEPLMESPEWKDLQRTANTFGIMGGVVVLLAGWKVLRLTRRVAGA
jgi:hypothetical protein